jgi:hypothetical protein
MLQNAYSSTNREVGRPPQALLLLLLPLLGASSGVVVVVVVVVVVSTAAGCSHKVSYCTYRYRYFR